MAPLLLQDEHDLRQASDADFMLPLLPPVLADEVILTIHAAEVAVAEENIADTPRPHQPRLLPEMGRPCRHHGKQSCGTTGSFSLETVVPALMRAYCTGGQHGAESVGPGLKLTGSMQHQV
jgi:hypothetical protein